MEREVVTGPGLPAQIGPYSQAVRAGDSSLSPDSPASIPRLEK